MAGSGGCLVFLAFIFLALSLISANSTISEIATKNKTDNSVQIFNLDAKPTKGLVKTLGHGHIHLFHLPLGSSDVLDLMRASVEILEPKIVENDSGKAPILEVTVSNGRDNFLLKLPVFYPNLTLFSDGKMLEPLIKEDFGMRKKKKNISEINGNFTQNLIVTVQSRLLREVQYKLQINSLDRSQYNLSFKKGKDTNYLPNQQLNYVKPIGFFLNSTEQAVRDFRITVTSDDDICAMLVTVPADESLYDRRVDAAELDNRRTMTFTRRADVFFSESEIEKFRNFRIFAFINPDDTACSPDWSRKSIDSQKKLNFEFSRNRSGDSYFLPIALLVLVFFVPGLVVLPLKALEMWRNHRNSQSIDENQRNEHGPQLIFFDDVSPPRSPPRSPQLQRESSLEEPLDPLNTTQSSVGPTGPVEIHVIDSDSLTLHGEMLRYPVAIILPVLMHTALEYHKFTTSSMANLDEMCFHNHACSKPLGDLRAFNNIISNLGFAIYGILFIAITIGRRRRETKGFGTFECTLLDVTIGVFMGMQALASAAYHICPSDVAFQFDTPCIQVICGLLILRQWLIRVESPSAAYSNLLLVGVVSLNFLVSALSNHSSIRYLIATLHIFIVIVFCLTKRTRLSSQGEEFHKKTSDLFMISFLGVNIAFMVFYTATAKIHLNQISTYCFIVNCIMYLVYYTFMKTVCREKITPIAGVCGALAVMTWLIAAYFFYQDDTDWTKTAAASRALNKPCLLLDFFGSHDLWHIFGAFAGLFTFLFVSIIDDDLLNTPKHSIHLF